MKVQLRKLFIYGRNWKSKAYVSSFFSIAEKLFDVFPEILIGVAVDLVVNKSDSLLGKWGIINPFHQILILGFLTGVVWSLESLFEYLAEISWRKLAQDVQHTLRMDTYDHIQRLDLSWYNRNSTGDILSVVNDGINQLELFINTQANNLVQLISSTVIISGIFIFLSPKIAFYCMISIPFILVGSFMFQSYLFQRYLKVRKSAGEISSQLTSNFQGIYTIKSFTAEGLVYDELNRKSLDYVKNNRSAFMVISMMNPVIRTIIMFAFLIALIYGGYLTLDGKLAIGSYSALIFLTQRFLWPFKTLGEISDSFQRAMAAADRIFEVLDTGFDIRSPQHPKVIENIEGKLDFENVSFQYDESDVVSNLSVRIKAGEYIGLVGGTGSGKSTLLNLLFRFYDPKSGRILVDGVDIRELDIRNLRSSIGLVSQEPFLLDGNIYDNITFGLKSATREDVYQAAKFAEIHGFIEGLKNKYDTRVGEGGVNLSGGQRQRICIARAILRDPKILILDEATASVDNETEASIQRSLLNLKHSRTMLVIAHRLSTVRFADRILVMSNKNIAEEGTHEELVTKGGIYANLWKIQCGEV